MIIPEYERVAYDSLIRKLTFRPCITYHDFIDMLLERELGYEYYDKLMNITTSKSEDKAKHRKIWAKESERVTKRYKRLLQLIVAGDVNNKSPSKLLQMPRRYDDIMVNHQIRLYNSLVKELNACSEMNLDFPEVKVTITKKHVLNELSSQGIKDNIKVLNRFYPYLLLEERNGFNYVESIILTNILLVKHSRALYQLGSIINKTASREAVEAWVDDIISNMRAEHMQRQYIDILFYIFHNMLVEPYNDMLIKYGKNAWLPAQYRDLKDTLRAIEKHGVWQGDEISFEDPLKDFIHDQRANTFTGLELALDAIIPSARNYIVQKHLTPREAQMNIGYEQSELEIYFTNKAQGCIHIVELFISASLDTAEAMLREFLLSNYPNN